MRGSIGLGNAGDTPVLKGRVLGREQVGVLAWRRAGLIVFMFALVIRLWGLDAHGLWYDEVASLEPALHGLDGVFNWRFGWVGNQTPFHYLIVWLTVQPVDPAITAFFVRLPSALAGALLVGLTYEIGRILFGRMHGVVAAVLMSLAPTALEYAQDLRPYALTSLFVAFAVYCLLRMGLGGPDEKPASPSWWVLFVASALACVYNSYTALVMAVPSLMIVYLWAALKWWSGRKQHAGNLRASAWPLLSLGVLGLALLPAALDTLRLSGSGSPTAWDLLTPISGSTQIYETWAWFTRFGLSTSTELLMRFLMVMLMLVGIYVSVRRQRQPKGSELLQVEGSPSLLLGIVICSLFMIVPLLIFLVYSLMRPGIPRYVLFVMPFLYLFMAAGALGIGAGLKTFLVRRLKSAQSNVALLVGSVPVLLVVFLFMIGFYRYSVPDGYSRLADKADFRSALYMLEAVAEPEDVIIVANNPEHGITISDFYWKGTLPARVINVLDPKLFHSTKESTGKVFWLMATWSMRDFEPHLLENSRWYELYSNGRVILLEDKASAGVLESVEYMASYLLPISRGDRLVHSMLGSVYQQKGDLQGAIEQYREASAFFRLDLAGEYIRTANGFAAEGDLHRAWREVLSGKLEDAGDPAVHRWLAERLEAEGLTELSRQETQIADLLEAGR